MKLYSYLMLDDTAQWNQLWDLGTYLTHIEVGDSKYVLYGIGDFYVEVKYGQTDNKILDKLQFKKGETLEKYLELFEIPF